MAEIDLRGRWRERSDSVPTYSSSPTTTARSAGKIGDEETHRGTTPSPSLPPTGPVSQTRRCGRACPYSGRSFRAGNGRRSGCGSWSGVGREDSQERKGKEREKGKEVSPARLRIEGIDAPVATCLCSPYASRPPPSPSTASSSAACSPPPPASELPPHTPPASPPP